MRTREKVIGYRNIRIRRNVIRKLLCIGCSYEYCVLQLNKDLSDLYCHLMHTTLWRYSSLYNPKVRIRDMIQFLWLQNASRERVKIPWAFILSALVLESTGASLNGFGFSSFSSLSFLLQFSWPHSWEMTPIKTLWGQGWLMYHWPQIIQDVAKPWFLSCLPSTPILPDAPQDHLLPGLRASLLEWPWPPYLETGHVPGWGYFCPVFTRIL